MASFTNQTSNLSALAASLDSLARYLDAAGSGNVVNEDLLGHEESAHSFLYQQHRRLCNVEADLIRSTEHILPCDSECWTLTEMSGLCKALHASNLQRMRRIHGLLSSDPRFAIQSQESETDLPSPHWSHQVGKPLDPVDETDHETDGTITPGSFSKLSSPPLSTSSSQRGKPSETSYTPLVRYAPDIDETAETNVKNIVVCEESPPRSKRISYAKSPDLVERWRLQRRSLYSDDAYEKAGDLSAISTVIVGDDYGDDEEFGDQTFEFSVATGPTVVGQGRRTLQLNCNTDEEKEILAQDFSSSNRGEGVQDDDMEDESLLLTPATEYIMTGAGRGILQPNAEREALYGYFSEVVQPNQGSRANVEKLEQAVLQTKMESLDATNVMAANYDVDRDNVLSLLPNGLSREVLVNNSSPVSAAATELTMDEAIQNTSGGSPTFVKPDTNIENFENDQASEAETPILDRYRLEPDDNSIGVKVVPNERRRRRGVTGWVSQELTVPKQFSPIQEKQIVLESPQEKIDGRLTWRTYRKTPYPRPYRGSMLDYVDEENESPNAVSKASRGQDRIPLGEIDLSQAKTPAIKSRGESMESFSRTPLTSAWIAKHMSPAEISHLMDSIESPNTQEDTRQLNVTALTVQENKRYESGIQVITMEEYKSAARVVQMQVSAEEVNQSIDVLNSWIHGMDIIHFSEDEACVQLQQRFSLRKSKTILMSLCHWRRIGVRLNNGRKEFHIRNTSAGDSGDNH